MGTNYYAEVGPARLRYHVGKLSACWQFVFRGYSVEQPAIGVVESAEDWRAILKEGNCTIHGGSGPVKPQDFWMLVERSRGGRVRAPVVETEWWDDEGWFFIGASFS